MQAAFTSAAPEFSWTTGAVTQSPSNAISYAVIAVAAPSDAQGIIVSSLSKNNGQCWYAMQLNASPTSAGMSSNTGNFGAFAEVHDRWRVVRQGSGF